MNNECIVFLVVFLAIVIASIFLVLDFLKCGRNYYKKSISELYDIKSMGTALYNVLSLAYAPAIFWIFSNPTEKFEVKLVVLIGVFMIAIMIQCRIYKCEKRIRSSEKDKRTRNE